MLILTLNIQIVTALLVWPFACQPCQSSKERFLIQQAEIPSYTEHGSHLTLLLHLVHFF